VHFRRGAREAAFVCNREKDLQGAQFHSARPAGKPNP
jgi:hypothetical protein